MSLFAVLFFSTFSLITGQNPEESFQIRGLSIAAPSPDQVDRFIKFMDEELGPNGVNTLILRVDYGYEYQSRPELRDDDPLSKRDVKKIVQAGKRNRIRLIPQVNLLGHQSWASNVGKLLEVYPEFDETPQVELPAEYKWPNEDGLYCKSYCPLHPGVHDVVFDIVDEIVDVFEANAFHAGMDEVFYIGHPDCGRCSGKDRSELFAGEVKRIRDHLAATGKELWIWGDRLIDGEASGLGMWEASTNDTHRAIDRIPKDVFICDWHYERADPTAVIFALKGLRVATCTWRKPKVVEKQVELMSRLRESATEKVRSNYQGMIQTTWTSAGNFLDMYYGISESETENGDEIAAFRVLLDEFRTHGK